MKGIKIKRRIKINDKQSFFEKHGTKIEDILIFN
jgi:hypothetical protein